jgi:hypothetical protein
MIKYGELSEALLCYTHGDIHDEIPVDYYRRIIKAWLRVNNNEMNWDVQQAASILLYLAVREGSIDHSQLNEDGVKSLYWAEKLLEQDKMNENHEVIRALSTVSMAS